MRTFLSIALVTEGWVRINEREFKRLKELKRFVYYVFNYVGLGEDSWEGIEEFEWIEAIRLLWEAWRLEFCAVSWRKYQINETTY